MKKIDELNKNKVPIVRIDNSLEQFKGQPLFQEKVDKANEILKNIGLPKIKKHHT
ncbi:hypothetical protein [Lunatimonas salinarum]|uniref:hypothetical protein n=1 Tax=Lunatimonas salinarum TaxID=1774590 RepID=UPI001ADF6BBA|nr:hypothetical protein [Lunatimonas salinarum]